MTAAVVPGEAVIYPAIRERLTAIIANHGDPATGPAPASSAAATPASARTSPTPPSPTASPRSFRSIGMTNAEAITNVTAFAAEVCGVADRTGTLEPGKDADILAVAGNPLDDITATPPRRRRLRTRQPGPDTAADDSRRPDSSRQLDVIGHRLIVRHGQPRKTPTAEIASVVATPPMKAVRLTTHQLRRIADWSPDITGFCAPRSPTGSSVCSKPSSYLHVARAV